MKLQNKLFEPKICGCGKQYTPHHFKRHEKSQKLQDWLKQKEQQEQQEEQLKKKNHILFIILTSKQDIISNIYYDRSGFGSRAQTLKHSREKDATVTREDVEEFFKRNIEEKRKMRGENSFIPKKAMWEFQFDLFFVNDIPDQKFKVGAIMIDAFSKYMVVIPIKSKSEGDVASALIEGFNKMGGTPKLLYTDDEGALNTKSIQDYLKEKI